MNLKKYDNKLVQITCTDSKVYEGICSYNNKDYCFHEFGRSEESLEIFHFLFYKCDITKIKLINKFSEPFGEIEKETCEDIDLLEQALDFDEDDIHVYRVLCYLETIEIDDEIIKLLKKLAKENYNKEIITKAKELIKRGNNNEYRKRD